MFGTVGMHGTALRMLEEAKAANCKVLLPLDVATRTCVALVVGPLVGLGVHLVGVLRA